SKGSNNMATPVKIIPTLHGEAARAFIERAEKRERNPHPTPIYTITVSHWQRGCQWLTAGQSTTDSGSVI
ncbi:MAG: hypothetical protein IJ804_08270, partial [Prevotella sp.]|nr:hypothetical protein [Prevotella sp.]